jgi:ribosomal protein S15P/S13E
MPKKSETIKTKKEEEKVKEKPKKVSQLEFEKKVIELMETGLTSEKIGEKLRKENIHPKEFNKKISKIIKDKDKTKYINADLKNIEEKLEKIKKHYANNKQDKRAMREKDRIFAQLRKLKKYFKII